MVQALALAGKDEVTRASGSSSDQPPPSTTSPLAQVAVT
jgi:hypothetical protein